MCNTQPDYRSAFPERGKSTAAIAPPEQRPEQRSGAPRITSSREQMTFE